MGRRCLCLSILSQKLLHDVVDAGSFRIHKKAISALNQVVTGALWQAVSEPARLDFRCERVIAAINQKHRHLEVIEALTDIEVMGDR